MSNARTPRRAAVVAALLIGTSGAVGYAMSGAVDAPATVSAVAERIDPGIGDLAVAYDIGDVDQFVVTAADQASHQAGGFSAPARGGSVGLRRITRAGATVHAPPSGYLVPMVFSAVPMEAARGVHGLDVAAVLDTDTMVINEMTADQTGAQVGDVFELRAASGATVPVRVAGIRPYAQVGGSELVFDTTVASRLGFGSNTRVVMWGFDRAQLDQALVEVGLTGRRDTKVGRSWDPVDPDDTISTARTKAALGEPWYRVNSDGSISMHPDWKSANLTDGRVTLNSSIPIRAQCHVAVVGDLRAAIAEVAQAGLGWAIDAANANEYGGCYVPRYSRVSGYLSRHSYGMALDTNTTSNCQGCRPQMHCDVVRIFRKHGFAWGGNFRRPDGMHFEWVGGRRDQIAYPSNYCPNIVNPLTQSAAPPTVGRDVLLQGRSLAPHDHSHQ